jgi:hypothetical protein
MARGASVLRLRSGASRALVERLGGHPAARWGIDLARESGRREWLAAALLLAGRAGEARADAALAALARVGGPDLAALADADPAQLGRALQEARIPDAEAVAARLVRAGRALAGRHAGSLDALAREALDLEELAARIASLAPGFGAATVGRFLRPLRALWPAAREVPLAPAARAAALDLGWLAEGEDEEGEPAALAAALAGDPEAPAFADVEAALERLGAAACLRGRLARCPLADACPRRA